MFEDIFAKIFIIGFGAFLILCGYADYKHSTENAKQKYRVETPDHIYYTNEYTIRDGCAIFISYVSSKQITVCGSYEIR